MLTTWGEIIPKSTDNKYFKHEKYDLLHMKARYGKNQKSYKNFREIYGQVLT